MSTEVTFLDVKSSNYGELAKVLREQGYSAVRSTSGNRMAIQVKYAYFLANKLAKEKGLKNASQLGPSDLQAIWQEAGKEATHFEMYMKKTGSAKNAMRINNGNTIAAVEMFASNEDVEKMQPFYVEIEDIISKIKKPNSNNSNTKERPSHSYARHLLGYENNNNNEMTNNNEMSGGRRKKRMTKHTKRTKHRRTTKRS